MPRVASGGTLRLAASATSCPAKITTQAGLAVQQDLALVNPLGLTDVERNGHHYVNGMADCRNMSRTLSSPPTPPLRAHLGRRALESATDVWRSARSQIRVSPPRLS